MYNRYSWEGALAESLAGLAVVLFMVGVLLSIWLMLKTIQMLVRVFAAHPRNKVLLGTLGAFLTLLLLVMLTNGEYQPINSLAGLALFLLLAIAWVIDIADDTRVRRPLDRNSAVHAVLHEWWPAA